MSNKEKEINECDINKNEEIFPKEDLKEGNTNDNLSKETKDKKKDKKYFKKNNQELDKLKEEITKLKEDNNLLKESLLRNQAELQNYKRRKDEETTKILKYKDEDLIKELLPMLDNLERAIKMDDNDLTDEVSRFLEGVKLIYSNTLNVLDKFEVKEIEAEGIEFNPEYHHAVLTDHDQNKPEGVVLEVLQKGYIYKDRVVRPSMVKVNE